MFEKLQRRELSRIQRIEEEPLLISNFLLIKPIVLLVQIVRGYLAIMDFWDVVVVFDVISPLPF